MLIGTLLAGSAPGWPVEPAPPPAKTSQPVLSLHAPEVQKVIRAAAKTPADTAPLNLAPAVTLGGQVTIPFRAPRRPHHMQCDDSTCVAYTADDVALYTIPRYQYYGDRAPADPTAGEWLSCQSRDDLLTTFERYDQCRGITIGLPPLALGKVQIETPEIFIH
jgi:hypothetical protein